MIRSFFLIHPEKPEKNAPQGQDNPPGVRNVVNIIAWETLLDNMTRFK